MGPNSDNPPCRTFSDHFWLSHSALAATLPRPKPFATEASRVLGVRLVGSTCNPSHLVAITPQLVAINHQTEGNAR